MRRSSRMVANKRVLISEGDDEERLKKTEAKKAIIRAEFEKHKKELRVNNADPSKTNEIRLKNQLEELLTGNEKKRQDLLRMENQERNLEQQNLEATQFFDTVTRFNMSKANETFLSAGFYPNRTTTRLDGLKEANTAEALSEKKLDLVETLKNIELLIEQEDETSGTVFERYEELRKNQVLLGKKVNELRRMNEHSEKRFADLKRIEFLAFTKKATTESNLKELREEVRGLKGQETEYMMQKEHAKRKEVELLNAKQTEMSNILIELDKKRLEHQQKQEEVRKLELQYEDVKDKRKNTKIVTKYIEALNALFQGSQGNLMVAHKALQDLSERLDNSRDFSPYKSPSQQENRTPYNFDDTPKRLKSHGEDDEMITRRDSLLDRKYYIDKIKKFYDDHPEGPDKFADQLIQLYMDECYKEESFKTLYEEQQAQRTHQENLLQTLEEELRLIKGKNEYITLGRTGSKILESNEQEAIDSGMVVIDAQATTLNQAKFELANKLESDNQVNLFTATEAFVMRCYLDSIEMISRFSKILASVSQQAGMHISEELKEVLKNITTQVQQFKKGRKSKQQELSTSQASDAPEIHRTHTENSNVSEREKISEREKENELSLVALDLQEIYEIFVAIFDGYTEEAAEFVSHVRSVNLQATDIIISSFITIDDIKNYLQNCQVGIYIEIQIQKAFNELGALRKISIENMLQKFDIIYKLYLELVLASEKANKEVKRLLTVKGIELDDGMRRKSEPNVFVKKALQKKWQNLMDRYEYDPNKDYRKDAIVEEKDEQNQAMNKKQYSKENIINDKETYDREDVKAKLNEMGGSKYKKMAEDSQDKNGPTLFRANEEEKKRFQAKKAIEKQKQAIDNMDDEEFLDWQRKQIKAVKEEYVYEYTEGELLLQAQHDLAQRLSQAEPLAELKKMIENSKFISKIQMLEKQKSVIDGKKTLKHDFVESYIPPDPIKVPKSAMSKANQEYRLKTTTRTVYTPSINSARLASERRRTETDYDDSTKELSFRAATTKSTSRFKPDELQLNFSSARTRETDKTHNLKSGSYTQRNNKQWPLYGEDDANKLSGKSAFSLTLSQKVRETGSNKDQDNKKKEKHLAKSKSSKVDLPKLEKPKKKVKMYKKKKTVSSDVNGAEHDNLTQFLNLQTDPLYKMVYSPNFLTSGIRSMAFNDPEYHFDSYQFKAPGLLVSEQR